MEAIVKGVLLFDIKLDFHPNRNREIRFGMSVLYPAYFYFSGLVSLAFGEPLSAASIAHGLNHNGRALKVENTDNKVLKFVFIFNNRRGKYRLATV